MCCLWSAICSARESVCGTLVATQFDIDSAPVVEGAENFRLEVLSSDWCVVRHLASDKDYYVNFMIPIQYLPSYSKKGPGGEPRRAIRGKKR